jgi:hypothetical protein
MCFMIYAMALPLPFKDSSKAFIAPSETAQWPFCFRTVHAAASADSPCRYVSVKRQDLLMKRRITSTGQAQKRWTRVWCFDQKYLASSIFYGQSDFGTMIRTLKGIE